MNKTSTSKSTHEPTMSEGLAIAIGKMQQSNSFPRSVQGYKAEAKAFARQLGAKANALPHELTLAECNQVCQARLSQLSPNTDSAKRSMANLRFVLKSVEGFPRELIDVFVVPKNRREIATTMTLAFEPTDITAMAAHLPQASELGKGLYYLGSNGMLHLGDAATATCCAFRDAQEGVVNGHRVKTGQPFRCALWPETTKWLETRTRDPKAIYLFPEFVFSRAELKNDPSISHKELSSTEQKERTNRVTARANAEFDKFLLACGIKRKGISFRTLRATIIRFYEARGVPRSVAMEAPGHSEERS